MENPQTKQVPVKARHKIKVIITSKKDKLEDYTNEFLKKISDELLLKNIVFAINPKNGDLIHIIHYTEVSPMTREEWEKKQTIQDKFKKGFNLKNLLQNNEKISNL